MRDFLGELDNGPRQDGTLMGRSLDQKSLEKMVERDDAGSADLSGAQDDYPGWAGDRELQRREKNAKKEKE